MKLINIGSLNIDRVYGVDHFVMPGETEASDSYAENVGGKGLNQSVAASRAGMQVCHAGRIGPDGRMLTEYLSSAGVNTEKVVVDETAVSGHAIIQVDKTGQNSILLFGGANRMITEDDAAAWLADCTQEDILLLQNETSALDAVIDLAYAKKMRIVLNPSPVSPELLRAPLGKVSLLILNETEGNAISGKTEPEEIIEALRKRFTDTAILLTLGGDGSMFSDEGGTVFCEAFRVETPVDTTGAGDTYTGFFICKWAEGEKPLTAMKYASAAAALAVGRPGAAASVPSMQEVEQYLRQCGM